MNGEAEKYKSVSNVKTLRPSKVQGKLLGGNLSILVTTLGTPYQANYDGALLFVEILEKTHTKLTGCWRTWNKLEF